jgi:hypothetical protein
MGLKENSSSSHAHWRHDENSNKQQWAWFEYIGIQSSKNEEYSRNSNLPQKMQQEIARGIGGEFLPLC